MPARDIQLADAIVEEINDQDWSLDLLCTRAYVTDWDVDGELAELQCAVIPTQRRTEPGDRRRPREICPVLICFGQRLQQLTIGEIDVRMLLVEEVIDHLERIRLTAGIEPAVKAWRNTVWEDLLRFDPDALKRDRQGLDIKYTGNFLSVTRMDFVYLTPDQ